MKRAIYILALLSVILAGCRSPKTLTTDMKLKEQKDIENNISLVETSKIDQAIDQAMQKYVSEKLNININNKVYDTEKPADPETGKSPLKEETNVSLSKETNATTAEIVKAETTEVVASQFDAKSTDKSKVDNSEKTKMETRFGPWQKVLIGIGLTSIIGFILFIRSKIK